MDNSFLEKVFLWNTLVNDPSHLYSSHQGEDNHSFLGNPPKTELGRTTANIQASKSRKRIWETTNQRSERLKTIQYMPKQLKLLVMIKDF